MDLKSLTPYKDFLFIAEAGVNHEGSINEAIKMVEAASKAGANIIKFQAYNANKLAHKNYAKAYWDQNEEKTNNQHALFSKYATFSLNEWKRVKKACEDNDIFFWLSIFDLELARNLYQICDGIKVASGDITFDRLHEFILSLNMPSIFSTGASSIEEISDLDEKIRDFNAISLFCRLSYPTRDDSAEMGMFPSLAEKFSSMRGVSDHCRPGNGESVILAFNLGATVVEKHFTLTPNIEGNDHYHSITPDVLSSTINSIKRMADIYKVSSEIIPTQTEIPARKGARRSLFFTNDLTKGHVVSESDLIELRPVIGVEANFISKIIGKRLLNNVKSNDAVKYEDLI